MSRQRGLNEHLIGKGLSDTDTVYNTMLEDLLPLMPSFLASGGTYNKTGPGDLYPTGISRRTYPTPKMKVMYGSNSLVLTKEILEGYPVLILMERPPAWDTYLVHPDHLDTALCYLLGVPNHEP